MALLLNAVVTILETIGLYMSFSKRKWHNFVYYTQISNLLTFISSLLYLLSRGNDSLLRYLSSVMLTMTFLITVFVLVPMGGDFKELMLQGNGIYHHTLCPILSVFSYLVFEKHAALWQLPVVMTIIYGLTMMYLNYIHKADGPYPFFRVHNQSALTSLIWICVLTVLISILSIGIIKAGALLQLHFAILRP